MIDPFQAYKKKALITWQGGAIALLIASFLLCTLSAWDLWDKEVSLTNVVFYLVVQLTLLSLSGVLFVLLATFFQTLSNMYKLALASFITAFYLFFSSDHTPLGLSLIALWAGISFSLVGEGGIRLIRKEYYRTSLLSFSAGILGIILLSVWFVSSPKKFSPPDPLKGGESNISQIPQNPALSGQEFVLNWTYGSGRDLHRKEYGEEVDYKTEPVDGRAFIHNWNGLVGSVRSRYWGFDPSELPLNARVWVPQGSGPFPLILIVHGNHEMMASSELGYGYLGKLLASRGFIVASIDENFLNGSWLNFSKRIHEVPARGWLILEHLKLWRVWDRTEGHFFYNKVDMNHIGLIGHSRGGEAIATAAGLNHLKYFPEDGNIKFDYNFNIKALAAISPVDGQYKPGGLRTELQDIDYFVIHGSQDGDVRSFEGTAQYHRINFDEDYHFKATLYVLGANHGQFNTIWGRKDVSSPSIHLFDLDQIMSEEDQQQIAKVFLSAFFETSLKGKKEFLPLFIDNRAGTFCLPKTLYLNQFADSTFQYIDNIHDDIDISKTSIKGGRQKGKDLEIWKQSQVTLKQGKLLHPATILGWDHSLEEVPSYRIILPEKGLKLGQDSILVLSLANGEDGNSEPAEPIDFTLSVTDSNGEQGMVSLSDFAYLPAPIFVKTMKASILDPYMNPERVFQSFEFPLATFVAHNKQLNPEKIKKIEFLFDKTAQGKIIVDTIAFRSSTKVEAEAEDKK